VEIKLFLAESAAGPTMPDHAATYPKVVGSGVESSRVYTVERKRSQSVWFMATCCPCPELPKTDESMIGQPCLVFAPANGTIRSR